jgi:hypothetical protein
MMRRNDWDDIAEMRRTGTGAKKEPFERFAFQFQNPRTALFKS